MLVVVQDGLMSHYQFGVGPEIVASVGIAVPAWEVAAGHVQADTVSCLEHIAGSPKVNLILVGVSWLNQSRRFSLCEVAIARTNNTIGQILRVAIRMDIHQARYKIGIARA